MIQLIFDSEPVGYLTRKSVINIAYSIGWWLTVQLTKATGEVESTTADGASSALTDDDSLWGRQPPRTAGNGLEESHRKFAACRRKYLIRYLNLLARTGNFATLAAAHSFLASPQQWSNPSMMADIARCVTLQKVIRTNSTPSCFPYGISPVP